MPLPFRNTEEPRTAPYLATVVVLPIPDIVPTTVVVEPDAAADGAVVATGVVGTVPVMSGPSLNLNNQPPPQRSGQERQ